MKIDWKGLIEGVTNSIFPAAELQQLIVETSEDRLSICKTCKFFSPIAIANGYETKRPDVFCTDCGCNLEFKTKCLSCACPQEKWKAVLNNSDEGVLIQKIKDGKEHIS